MNSFNETILNSKALLLKFNIIMVFCLFSCQQNVQPTLNIAAAASVQYALQELILAFQDETNIQCNIVSSSSGKLTAQINEGATFDLFFSADMKYPQFLYDKGLADQKPIVYALGSLVLWTINDAIEPSLGALQNENVRHIAIANPLTAPYGTAALKIIESLENYDAIKEKLVFGESISQVNQFVNSGAADIGFTAQSVVLSSQLKGAGRWTAIDDHSYEKIEQGMIGLKNSNASPEAKARFLDFMKSTKANSILLSYGYKTNLN